MSQTNQLEMMDYRLKDLSYSSLLVLHSCPKKYQLYKLNSKEIDLDGDAATKQSVTFAFGHIVGEGIQELLRSEDIDKAIWKMFLQWDCDLFDRHEKQNKSFALGVFAVQKFASMVSAGLLNGYELAYYNGIPATELGFCITFPDGFRYRGFVDAVLVHKVTGKVLVLELKTTAQVAVNPATYKNSAQAIGYSVVLDVLFPELSSYEVLYLVYLTKINEYADPLMFNKSYLQRALWIKELLLDIETIKMYEGESVYPMHGESCFSWYRECEYYGLCTLDISNITKPTPKIEDRRVEEFAINLTVRDLIDAQIRKAG